MRHIWFCMPIVLVIAITVIGATTPATTRPSVKAPAYMKGLDPKGLGKPEDIVRRRWTAVMNVLRNAKLNQPTKVAQVKKIVSPIFDFRTMALLSLGKTNWRKFTTAQQTEFSTLFIERLKDSYGKRISDYGGEQVVFKPALPQKTRKSSKAPAKATDGPRIVHVPVEIASKTRKWIILHKFRKVGEVYRIYDIEIEGISILRSYRSQFNDILARGKPEDLLLRLRKPLPDPPAVKGGSRK
ncbi:MAG: ABC transporter substrate-binding protein [Phycisphaerales bacterium]|jgi:phospholipid transport system substrate-binding protein|nr:ABC transporter substrate-binding protein [Phycisphaerales bacterium]